jgi:hypothetical protein
MKLIAKTRILHRPAGKGATGSTIIEKGKTFELDDDAAKVLIEQGEAEEVKKASAEPPKDPPKYPPKEPPAK